MPSQNFWVGYVSVLRVVYLPICFGSGVRNFPSLFDFCQEIIVKKLGKLKFSWYFDIFRKRKFDIRESTLFTQVGSQRLTMMIQFYGDIFEKAVLQHFGSFVHHDFFLGQIFVNYYSMYKYKASVV